MARVTKLKVAPVCASLLFDLMMLNILQSKWDSDNLHRHADYKPVKREHLSDQEDLRMSIEDTMCKHAGFEHYKVSLTTQLQPLSEE